MLESLPTLLDAGLILIGIFILGFVALKVKIPSVVFYILFGISLAGLLDHNQLLHFSSDVAIVLLFFLLGLEFNMERLGGIAKNIWHAGLLDVVLSFGMTMMITSAFGMDLMNAFLIGGIAYATSSSITAKLLDDKGRMANTETEFMLGLLIFEDLVAPIAVAIMISLNSGDAFSAMDLTILLGKMIILAVVAIGLGKTVFKHFESFLDKLEEDDLKIALLVGIAISYAGLATMMGLSDVLGAFLAGVMLSEISKVELVKGVVGPVRDLLLPTFFVYFGTTINLGEGVPLPILLIVLLIWSIVAKVLVGMVGGRWYGLSPRVAFRAGVSFCSRGEFSVVIASIASGAVKVFAGVYIVLAAFLGMILFNLAPAITKKIYGTPVQKKKHIKVPTAGDTDG